MVPVGWVPRLAGAGAEMVVRGRGRRRGPRARYRVRDWTAYYWPTPSSDPSRMLVQNGSGRLV